MCTSTCARPSGGECHCPSCHHTFRDVEEFDSHRDNGRCVRIASTTHRSPRASGGTLAGRAPQGGTTGPRIPPGRTLNGRKIKK